MRAGKKRRDASAKCVSVPNLYRLAGERGIARWWVSFIRDDQRVKLEGIFDISLTADSLCQSLREWWNAEGEPRGPSGEAEGEGTDSDQDAAAPVGERAIRALGEVALRVKDLDRMQSFYERTVGLELMKRFPKSAFFRVAQGVGGHTQVFVLFDRSGDPESNGITAKATTLHHVAFTVLLKDFEAEKNRLAALGVPMFTDEHEWVHWRSFYVNDPEGNLVEWVCYDPDA